MASRGTVTGRLADKVALITGAGSGLGRSSALRFAEEGALVACVDLTQDRAAVTADEIARAGGQAIALGADVSVARDAERMTAATIEAFGRVDVVFANAGIAGSGNAMDLEEAVWDRVIDVDLKGVWLSSKYALRNMVARGSGTIINTASIGGAVGIAGIFPYAAAKGGVIAMTKQLAADFGHKGVRANAICPGTVPTPWSPRRTGPGSRPPARRTSKPTPGRGSTRWRRSTPPEGSAGSRTSLRWRSSWPVRSRPGSPDRRSTSTAATPPSRCTGNDAWAVEA